MLKILYQEYVYQNQILLQIDWVWFAKDNTIHMIMYSRFNSRFLWVDKVK